MRTLKTTQRGFSLIESMITMLVMAIGLLGLAVLQLRSVQFSQASLQQSMAAIQAADMGERLWSNLCALGDADVASTLIDEWQDAHTGSMAGWRGRVTRHAPYRYTIDIEWEDTKKLDTQGTAPSVLSHALELPEAACLLDEAS